MYSPSFYQQVIHHVVFNSENVATVPCQRDYRCRSRDYLDRARELPDIELLAHDNDAE